MRSLLIILFYTIAFTILAETPQYYFQYELNRPVKKNQSVSAIYGTDPEGTRCTYKIQSGTGQKYFTTDKYKGGIKVYDATYLNKKPGTYTLIWYAYDATRLYAIANITINVK